MKFPKALILMTMLLFRMIAGSTLAQNTPSGPVHFPDPAATNAPVDFVRADVTRLSQEGIGTDFGLIVDNGCLHNMSDGDRDAYVREVSAVAAPGARLLIVAFLPGGRFGVRGVQPAEMERRFTSTWTMLSSGSERELDQEQTPAKYYLYERKNP